MIILVQTGENKGPDERVRYIVARDETAISEEDKHLLGQTVKG